MYQLKSAKVYVDINTGSIHIKYLQSSQRHFAIDDSPVLYILEKNLLSKVAIIKTSITHPKNST